MLCMFQGGERGARKLCLESVWSQKYPVCTHRDVSNSAFPRLPSPPIPEDSVPGSLGISAAVSCTLRVLALCFTAELPSGPLWVWGSPDSVHDPHLGYRPRRELRIPSLATVLPRNRGSVGDSSGRTEARQMSVMDSVGL